MKINEAGMQILISSESLRLNAYLCPAGVMTIGYGTTRINGQPIPAKLKITAAQALEYKLKDLAKFEADVTRLVKVPLNTNQFSALVSLAYNIGSAALEKSTLLRFLNAGKFLEASAQFLRWDTVNGTPLRGLTIRRKREQTLFNARV